MESKVDFENYQLRLQEISKDEMMITAMDFKKGFVYKNHKVWLERFNFQSVLSALQNSKPDLKASIVSSPQLLTLHLNFNNKILGFFTQSISLQFFSKIQSSDHLQILSQRINQLKLKAQNKNLKRRIQIVTRDRFQEMDYFNEESQSVEMGIIDVTKIRLQKGKYLITISMMLIAGEGYKFNFGRYFTAEGMRQLFYPDYQNNFASLKKKPKEPFIMRSVVDITTEYEVISFQVGNIEEYVVFFQNLIISAQQIY